MSEYHTPVLLKESVSALLTNPSGVYVDATFGGGGHSRAILEQLSPEGRLIAIDQDSDALANAPDDTRLIPVHANFRFVRNWIRYNGFEQVDGILADLGVSSHQFDTAERGFSFRFDSGLDMRMNASGSANSAEDVLNTYTEEALERIFREYGEINNSRLAARLVCERRAAGPITTTEALNAALEKATPQFQRLMTKLREKYGSADQMPEEVRNEFHRHSLALMKWNGLLTFNFRSGWLFLFCLLDIPVMHSFFEGIAMALLAWSINHRHETFSKKIADKL